MFDSDYSSNLLNFQKQPRSKIRFDPFVFTSLIFMFVVLFSFLIYFAIVLIPIINNVNQLVSVIPKELEFYHQIVLQHNQTIYRLETKIEKYIDVAEIVVNPNVLSEFVDLIVNMKYIISNVNITQIQNNFGQIESDLNSIVHHLIH
jgi:hypothetical protein